MANKQASPKSQNQEKPQNPALYDVAGQADEALDMQEVSGNLERFPIYGVADFQVNKPIRGEYLGDQKRGVDNDGNDRIVHVLKNLKTGEKFGIWQRTGTAGSFANLKIGAIVDVTYLGQADKHPTDPMKSPPHQFKIMATKGSVGTSAQA